MTLDQKRLQAAAKETCSHRCAQLGEPPCFREDIGGEGALKSCPDNPTCLQSTAATITAYLEGDDWCFDMEAEIPKRFIGLRKSDGDTPFVGEFERDPEEPEQCWYAGERGTYHGEYLYLWQLKAWQPLPQPPKKGE